MAKKKKVEIEVNLIEKFIKDNDLDFTGDGSDLNGNCVILAGYACHIGIENRDKLQELCDEFDEDMKIIPLDAWNELQRVFKYALENNYAKYWETEEAKKTYKF